MTTAQEIREHYDMLYDYMVASRDQKNMKIFGRVMTEMLDYLAANKPDVAEEMVQKLEAIRWKQYLTPKEAQAIVDKMQPAAPWSREVWNKAMTSMGIPTEEAPCYNTCALWCEMNKQYSDHAETLAQKVWKQPLASIPVEELVPAIHAFALDVLKDKDGVYDIRAYFGL